MSLQTVENGSTSVTAPQPAIVAGTESADERFERRFIERIDNAASNGKWDEFLVVAFNTDRNGNITEKMIVAIETKASKWVSVHFCANTGRLYEVVPVERLEAPRPARRSVREVALVVVEELTPRKIDGIAHGLITDATKGYKNWESTAAHLRGLSEKGQLRIGVRKRFCLQCPAEQSAHSDMVAKLPVVMTESEAKISPLGNKTPKGKEKAELAARRAVSRAKRHAEQPSAGPGGSKPNPGADARRRREEKAVKKAGKGKK